MSSPAPVRGLPKRPPKPGQTIQKYRAIGTLLEAENFADALARRLGLPNDTSRISFRIDTTKLIREIPTTVSWDIPRTATTTRNAALHLNAVEVSLNLAITSLQLERGRLQNLRHSLHPDFRGATRSTLRTAVAELFRAFPGRLVRSTNDPKGGGQVGTFLGILYGPITCNNHYSGHIFVEPPGLVVLEFLLYDSDLQIKVRVARPQPWNVVATRAGSSLAPNSCIVHPNLHGGTICMGEGFNSFTDAISRGDAVSAVDLSIGVLSDISGRYEAQPYIQYVDGPIQAGSLCGCRPNKRLSWCLSCLAEGKRTLLCLSPAGGCQSRARPCRNPECRGVSCAVCHEYALCGECSVWSNGAYYSAIWSKECSVCKNRYTCKPSPYSSQLPPCPHCQYRPYLMQKPMASPHNPYLQGSPYYAFG